jgi:YHS domain-containing protein
MKMIDPVCKMEVDSSTNLRVNYQGKTYYFCSLSCKDLFLSQPDKYIAGKGKT